jgi:hypothetical protein
MKGMNRYTCRRKEMQQKNWNRAEGIKANEKFVNTGQTEY